MHVTLVVNKLAGYFAEYLEYEGILIKVVQQASQCIIELKTDRWLEVVEKYAKVNGVISITVRQP